MNRRLLRVTIILLAVMGSDACAQQPEPDEKSVNAPDSIAVYALSRGKGVPESAGRVMTQAEALFHELEAKKQVVRVYPVERLGIEGERRICAEFVDEEAVRAAYAHLMKLAEGAELLNVVIEPCVKTQQGEPR